MAHILLIEPDAILAHSYKTALEQVGHSVAWQVHPQHAINSMDSKLADVVILELQLAKHNGVEFLHEFRSYPEWGTIPVILHTMLHTNHPAVHQSLWQNFGISAHLYKPQASLADLVRTVNRTLAPVEVV
jgi:DNA-binding response OmpR family regulator